MRKNYSLYKNDPIPRQEIQHPGTSGNQVKTQLLKHIFIIICCYFEFGQTSDISCHNEIPV